MYSNISLKITRLVVRIQDSYDQVNLSDVHVLLSFYRWVTVFYIYLM